MTIESLASVLANYPGVWPSTRPAVSWRQAFSSSSFSCSFRRSSARDLNEDARKRKMQKPSYAASQKWNRKWGFLYTVRGQAQR